MSFSTPAEATAQYSQSGPGRVDKPAWRMILTGAAAGVIIGIGGVVTNTASHTLGNVSIIRMVSGLLFPFGLGMIILLGAELYTGNLLLTIPLFDKRITLKSMLRNFLFVYIGNFIGGLLVAAGCAFFGQLNYSGGQLAVFTVNLAAGKCGMPFSNGLVLGILCNMLVCIAVMMSVCAHDVPGKIMAAYTPVAFFVISGFEHCVANMYYIPAGLLAMMNPRYAALVVEAGIDISNLTWGNYILGNLLPVSLGNAIGGVIVGYFMWACYLKKSKA